MHMEELNCEEISAYVGKLKDSGNGHGPAESVMHEVGNHADIEHLDEHVGIW